MTSNYNTNTDTTNTYNANTNTYNANTTSGNIYDPNAHAYDHDASTVHSPTNEHLSEKRQQQDIPQAATTTTKRNRLNNRWLGWAIRALQLIFSSVTLGLAARSLDAFLEGEPRMRYTVFCGAITIVYLIILMIVSFAAPSLLLAGAMLVFEIILAIFWLASFIAVAARYSGFSCSRDSFTFFDDFGTVFLGANVPSSVVNGCHCGKAAAAFAAISFLLFVISSVLIFVNIINPLRKRHSNTSYVFTPTSKNDNRVIDQSTLALSRGYNENTGTNNTAGYDYESAVPQTTNVGTQQTYQTTTATPGANVTVPDATIAGNQYTAGDGMNVDTNNAANITNPAESYQNPVPTTAQT